MARTSLQPTWHSALAALQGEEKARKGVACLMHIVHHLYPKDLIFWKVLTYFTFQYLRSHGDLQLCCYSTPDNKLSTGTSASASLHCEFLPSYLPWIVNNVIPPSPKLIWNPIPCRTCHHEADTCTRLVIQGILHFFQLLPKERHLCNWCCLCWE